MLIKDYVTLWHFVMNIVTLNDLFTIKPHIPVNNTWEMSIINMHHYFIVFTISTQNMDFLIQIIKQNTTNTLHTDFVKKNMFLFFSGHKHVWMFIWQ